MKNSILKMMGIIFLFFLVSCDQSQSTYEYLMQHPTFLQKEAMRCQIVVAGDGQCDVVKRAANDFSKLVFEVQTNPEQFGERILRAQLLQGARLQEMNEMKKKLAELTQGTDKKNQIEEAKKSLQQAELAYQAQCSNVKILIAVVAMMRIE